MSVDLNDVHELSLDEIEAISGGVIAQFVAGIVIGVAVVIAASEDKPPQCD
jgi:lactobin A/cerein 7B family class IIb bacteriocin